MGVVQLPTIKVEVDQNVSMTNPTSPSWYDISSYVRSATWARSGRTDVLARTTTGTAEVIVDNRLAYFDPDFARIASDLRLHRLRISAIWNSTTYVRWQGWIQSIAVTWPAAGKDSLAKLTAADSLYILNLFDLGGVQQASPGTDILPADRPMGRFNTVCGYVPGLTSGYTYDAPSMSWSVCADVGAGNLTAGSLALAHLQQVEELEGGRLYVRPTDGLIFFEGRYYRGLYQSSSNGTIGDGGGAEIPYDDSTAGVTSDDANIWNESVINGGGTTPPATGYATNSASISAYGGRTYSLTTIASRDADTMALAQYLVKFYGAPAPKLPGLRLRPDSMATPGWATVFGIDNSERWTFKRRVSYGTISFDCFVEQISESVTPDTWDVTLQMLPCADYVASGSGSTLWKLGTSTLGSSTYLQY